MEEEELDGLHNGPSIRTLDMKIITTTTTTTTRTCVVVIGFALFSVVRSYIVVVLSRDVAVTAAGP